MNKKRKKTRPLNILIYIFFSVLVIFTKIWVNASGARRSKVQNEPNRGRYIAVFRIRIILMRIRIRGTASGMMDPDPGPVLDTDPDPDPT